MGCESLPIKLDCRSASKLFVLVNGMGKSHQFADHNKECTKLARGQFLIFFAAADFLGLPVSF